MTKVAMAMDHEILFNEETIVSRTDNFGVYTDLPFCHPGEGLAGTCHVVGGDQLLFLIFVIHVEPTL
jgi:hypothetical protein